ncbi:exosomal polycystin-1-interacting protein-like [Hoplias malabaricus]|uniref:exosomal polycystin-1-interacting protein-like n=1 Tax=Hoplias malabaricus TaxID=27720 RepID=UPI003461A6C0
MPSSCLQPLLCVLLPLHFARAEGQYYLHPNITLLFDSSSHGDSLRNCSCVTAVHQCEEKVANQLCSCSTVSRSSLIPAGLRWEGSWTSGNITVWAHKPWVLTELLNHSQFPELQIFLCAPILPTGTAQYLTLVGLRRLQVYTSNRVLRHKDQYLNIGSAGGIDMQDTGLSVTFLDVGSLPGVWHLKAYSVVGPPLNMLKQHFPNLTINIQSSDLENIHKPSILTFIY